MQVFVLDAMRTPVAPRGGKLRDVIVRNLAAPIVTALLERQDLSPFEIDHFIMGNALNAGSNPARVVALQVGMSEMMPSYTVDTNRNSGMDAIILGMEKIKSGAVDIVIAGGAESVSRSPMRVYRPIEGEAISNDGSEPIYTPWCGADQSMKECAERNAIDGQISEERQFDWFNDSLSKAHKSKERMKEEKVSASVLLNPDNGQISRSNRSNGVEKWDSENQESATHAASADAAAFVILVSEKWLEEHKRFAPVMLYDVKSMGSAADDPSWAVIDSCRSIMQDNNLTVDQFEIFEIIETFASQTIYCMDELGLDESRVNVGGGELARGNPLAAGSAVLLVRLFHEMKLRQAGQLGLATSAAAGGMGAAVIMQSQ